MSSAAQYEIQSQSVTFPVEVRKAASGSAGFLVPSSAAARLIPDAFEVAEFFPGRALCTLVLVDYRDNDLGDYNEMAVGFMVRPRGQRPKLPRWSTWKEMLGGRLASHITHMPVDQSFTQEAGLVIWGYPKTVQQIEIDYRPDRVTGRLTYDGAHAFTLSVPRGGNREVKDSEMTTLSMINDHPHRTQATQTLKGMGVRLGGAKVELGTGTIAEELRSLGLPRRSIMTTWIEDMSASFGPPQPLSGDL
ncbi:acetoacetate decarboxylase family protein [Myxococcota bacterium]|nr:acetoacetate decarboxylase family protein [Myxococcota bacterium]